jgi:hypothetical protein
MAVFYFISDVTGFTCPLHGIVSRHDSGRGMLCDQVEAGGWIKSTPGPSNVISHQSTSTILLRCTFSTRDLHAKVFVAGQTIDH